MPTQLTEGWMVPTYVDCILSSLSSSPPNFWDNGLSRNLCLLLGILHSSYRKPQFCTEASVGVNCHKQQLMTQALCILQNYEIKQDKTKLDTQTRFSKNEESLLKERCVININGTMLEIKFGIKRTIIPPLFTSIYLPIYLPSCLQFFCKNPGHKLYGNDIYIRDTCKYSDLVEFGAILPCGRLAEVVEIIKDKNLLKAVIPNNFIN